MVVNTLQYVSVLNQYLDTLNTPYYQLYLKKAGNKNFKLNFLFLMIEHVWI